MFANSFTIDRKKDLSYEDFVNDYLNKDRPVIIQGALDNWPAMAKWTPEYFQNQHGDKEFAVKGRTYQLEKFVQSLVSPGKDDGVPPYLNGIFIRDMFPEIASDIIPDLPYTLPDRLRSRWILKRIEHANPNGIPELLIAGRGAQFPLHFDVNYLLGFVVQIYGEKEFMVFPPDQSKYLYPKEQYPSYSYIEDVFEPDYTRYPLLKEVTGTKFILYPGEILFNPAGWWHTTRIPELSIAMVISTVAPRNWRMFCEDILFAKPQGLSKKVIKQIYITAADIMMRIEEFRLKKSA